MAFIYVLQDILGNVRYVGRTTQNINKRYNTHLMEAKKNNQTYKARWIRRCVSEGYLPIIRVIENVEGDDTDINLSEMYWIARYKREGCNLTNLTDGGEGMVNPSSNLRNEMAIRTRSRWNNPEYKKRVSASMKGKIFTKERCKKISDSKIGKPRSQETRKKLSLALLGKKRPDLLGHIVTQETRDKISMSKMGCEPWNKGKKPTQETLLRQSLSHKGKVLSFEHRKKISEGLKNSIRYRKII